jgi:hypothetical protein
MLTRLTLAETDGRAMVDNLQNGQSKMNCVEQTHTDSVLRSKDFFFFYQNAPHQLENVTYLRPYS